MITHLALPDFPPPPVEFYQHLLHMDHSKLISMPKHNKRNAPPDWWKRSIKRDGNMISTAHQENINLGTAFDQWIQKTFSPNQDADAWFLDAGLNLIIGQTTHTPHTDGRRWHLFWVITSGGPDCTTNFWIENGRSAQRPGYTAPSDYDDLTLVDQVRMPLGRWVLFNSRFLHSVENCTQPRLTVQISMKALPDRWHDIYMPGSMDMIGD